MSETMQEMPIRLAIRTEGTWVVAYHADQDTMEGAQELGRIRRNLLEGSEDGFSLWRQAMQHIYADLVEATIGARPVFAEPQTAPEHERTGYA